MKVKFSGGDFALWNGAKAELCTRNEVTQRLEDRTRAQRTNR